MTHKRALLLLCCATLAGGPADASHHTRYRKSLRQQRAPRAEVASLTGAQAIVAFSPNGDATRLVISAIRHARHQILVQAYSFSSRPIIRALCQAKQRGVDVEIILDHSNLHERYSGLRRVVAYGIPVWIDTSVRIAHNKVMLIDGRDVLTGSFNFSSSAQRVNAENLIDIENAPALVRDYTADWRWRQGLSQRYRH